MGNRIMDTRGEKALGVFLDRYFYPLFINQENYSHSERVYDVMSQKSGSDIRVVNSIGKILNIDEKAQLHYINNPKETFAFEVSYIYETGDLMDGWLVNDTNVTDCYLLVWINEARTTKLNRIVAEDYQKLEICYISKKKILNYLQSVGYSSNKIRNEARDLRTRKDTNKKEITEDCFLYHSKIEYDEDPINIVINKGVLEKLAIANYIVTKDEVIKK